jgi:hypothetical protein
MLNLNRTPVGLSRASTSFFFAAVQDVDGRVNPAMTVEMAPATSEVI